MGQDSSEREELPRRKKFGQKVTGSEEGSNRVQPLCKDLKTYGQTRPSVKV